mmetsp:Transcript_13757/g.24686  ORF Transcript_13757/g.24686 Transcript_13757/m.24686 type:complete len:98 (+) Transcript_13757:334-627(+)
MEASQGGGRSGWSAGELFIAAIIIDIIGLVSFGVPVAGEAIDVVWAPMSAALIRYFFPGAPLVFPVVGFTEELFPGIDFIPTALLTWIYVMSRSRRA